MTKTLATLIALTTIAASTAPALANNAPTPTFDAAIQFDASAPVDVIYTSIKKQSRSICKGQLRTVKSMSIRSAYLKTCTSELMASAIDRIEMVELQRYFAEKHNKPVTKKFAQLTR
ncbi:hypothetical protein ACFFUB_05215 [Algimonas porphyrae]|uniref:UrcA family protein n=1 Tax=Algimonas porphyrae TaxID=1128113 RepID=A0ABQ5V0Q6_9PROT|nr:hypothetical protein [Algimonas porphyrae]GLQ19822.1 hypothetical protein GCM10007854_07770 [Algimonas porphyrae]